MPALPRRRVLAGGAALLTGLAGCSESTTDTGSAPDERRPENVARDPDTVVLRSSDTADPLAWLPSDGTESGGSDGSDSPGTDALRHRLVASRTEADRVRFADADGAADARRFVAETDFASETLYVERHHVRECYVLRLCYVTWSATEIDTQYGRSYRDADVACEADARDAAVWLIRIPDALDPDEVSSRGSGMSGGGCTYPPYLRTTPGSGSPNATDAETTDAKADATPTTAGEPTTATAGTTGDSGTEGDR